MLCRTMGMGKSALALLVLLTSVPIAAARAETIDQLYEKAKLEKAVVFYTGGGPAAAEQTHAPRRSWFGRKARIEAEEAAWDAQRPKWPWITCMSRSS